MRRSIVMLAALGLVVAACGGGDSADSLRNDYVIAAAEGLSGSPDVPAGLDRGQLDCLAEGVVDAIGVDGLEQAGISPADLKADDSVLSSVDFDQDQADGVADAFFDCLDMGLVLAESLEGGVPGIGTECAAEAIAASDAFRAAFATSLADDAELAFDEDQARAVAEDFVPCIDFAEAFIAEAPIDLTEDEQACITEGIADVPTEPLVDGIAERLRGEEAGDEVGQAIGAAVAGDVLDCLPLGKIRELGLGS